MRLFAALLAMMGLAGRLLEAAELPKPPQPNIVIILADDIGFSDIGCYSLFRQEGFLHFTVRSRGGVTTTRLAVPSLASHLAQASVDSDGVLSLRLDEITAPAASKQVVIAVMPTDGLDVGSDGGGAVGPYRAPARFTGTIESVTIELGLEE
jgi:hypothetical protein